MTRKRPNLLANRTASVSLTRNGLTIQIDGVPATDAGLVSKALLDGIRNLVQAGYDELLENHGSHHAGAYGEVPDDADEEEARVPVFERRVGFTQA
jgi:hypothetical protein